MLDDEADEAGPVLSEVNDLLAKVDAGTDADDDVFDEVVAVAKALVLEQFGLAVLDLDGEGVVGADGLLDLPLELYLLLLLLLNQQELLLELALQGA